MGQPEDSHDLYAPPVMAERIETIGVGKAAQGTLKTLMLAVLAGAFIAFGAMLFTVVVSDSALGSGPTRWLGGIAFSLGLVLVLIGGAELFTGNSLMVMAWVDRKIGLFALSRNWGLVYLGNLIGAVATVAIARLAEIPAGASAETAAKIAAAKTELAFETAFFRGLLCNVLVCLAVWLSLAARTVTGKAVAITLPVAAFVALGLEHSIANMYLIPAGQLAGGGLDLAAFFGNLLPVTLGNVVGGGVLVALVYWIAYRRAG